MRLLGRRFQEPKLSPSSSSRSLKDVLLHPWSGGSGYKKGAARRWRPWSKKSVAPAPDDFSPVIMGGATGAKRPAWQQYNINYFGRPAPDDVAVRAGQSKAPAPTPCEPAPDAARTDPAGDEDAACSTKPGGAETQ